MQQKQSKDWRKAKEKNRQRQRDLKTNKLKTYKQEKVDKLSNKMGENRKRDRWFSIRSRNNLSLVIPNTKTSEH